ncbi:alpha/beta hydrolase (plasmid) [Pseudonocardia sp. EC080610-09]|uniref:alpha/beta fold hydrolase n=1 Tax=unclassified Pseudonocardia TaxID=2619320 RepID=UPI0007057DB9|nr:MULTISPECIES: alpha/beta hydrolase [unclassified Pseudonocardia]ALL79519.1 alpha/beta hydrolase [Pseudonocardia sp. EC080610-09]ALL85529.1 alpha/beta hydrolase [Pseudonocardia sp. EC080619-01]
MSAVNSTVLAAPGAAEPPAVFVHGVLSWGTDDRYGFGHQRPLAAHRRLILMDRRGHGDSPDLEGPYRTDYTVDAEDIIALLGDGAHLVGHSYGGVAAMLAASARPDLVRSLCLIQPGALRVAENEPVVRDTLARARASTATLPDDLTAADYLRMSTESLGMPAPPATPGRLRAAWTSMGERPCWDAEIDVSPLAAATWPASVIVGDWADAPAEYLRLAGDPLTAAAHVLAERIGAELLTVPGFYPQTQQPEAINDALTTLWAMAS